MKHFPFKVINKSGQPRVSVDVAGSEKTFTPEEVSAMVLNKMSKDCAERFTLLTDLVRLTRLFRGGCRKLPW